MFKPVLAKKKMMNWSGRLDLNQRPLVPQTSALPGCATPRSRQVDYHPDTCLASSEVNINIMTFFFGFIGLHNNGRVTTARACF